MLDFYRRGISVASRNLGRTLPARNQFSRGRSGAPGTWPTLGSWPSTQIRKIVRYNRGQDTCGWATLKVCTVGRDRGNDALSDSDLLGFVEVHRITERPNAPCLSLAVHVHKANPPDVAPLFPLEYPPMLLLFPHSWHRKNPCAKIVNPLGYIIGYLGFRRFGRKRENFVSY